MAIAFADNHLGNMKNPLPSTFDLADSASPKDELHITARERQVLDLLALGYTSREIGDELNISHRTVENHSASLRRKLRVRNTVSLIRALLRGRVPGCSPRSS